VNAGEFDPLAAMADLARHYNAWLHVDGHKWLNVPYDCGYAFVRGSWGSRPLLP
jgi:glutamate/tyrosine decarboxylase-like PLP-dependent enzyme